MQVDFVLYGLLRLRILFDFQRLFLWAGHDICEPISSFYPDSGIVCFFSSHYAHSYTKIFTLHFTGAAVDQRQATSSWQQQREFQLPLEKHISPHPSSSVVLHLHWVSDTIELFKWCLQIITTKSFTAIIQSVFKVMNKTSDVYNIIRFRSTTSILLLFSLRKWKS